MTGDNCDITVSVTLYGSTNNFDLYDVIGFDKKSGSPEDNRLLNEKLHELILKIVENKDGDEVEGFVREAFKGLDAGKLMRHVYWAFLRRSETPFMDHYCGTFVNRLLESEKLTHYIVLTTLYDILPRLYGLMRDDYSMALSSLARFLREVYYTEELEEPNEKESDPGVHLNSKIEYLLCRQNNYSSSQKAVEHGSLELKERLFLSKEEIEEQCFEDILCAFLDLTRREFLFADVLKRLSEYQTVSPQLKKIIQLELAEIVSTGDYVKMSTISCSYADIKAASKLLRNVVDSPRLHPDLFYTPWYIPSTSNKLRTELELEKREILKINLYYFSRISRNLDDLLFRLVAAEILQPEDVSSIQAYETPLEKSVILFTKLILKDRENLPLVIEAMRVTNNEEIADILETDVKPNENSRPKNKPGETSSPVEPPDQSPSSSSSPKKTANLETITKPVLWSCCHCTFDNDQELLYCEQCCRSRYGSQDGHSTVYQCQICTLINEPGASHCEVCENPLPDSI